MILEQLYKNKITRPLNPAVSVTDNSESTVKVEIEEYVFTDEILNGLYDVLNAVRCGNLSYIGIWINGYYGSGKSHFLKYLNFCLDPKHRDLALERMVAAVKNDFDPLVNPDSKLKPTLADFQDMDIWLKKAQIDTVLFNIGDKIGGNTANKTTFAKAIWEEFNGFRGFNKFNISLAQYLEKPLQEKGKLEAFKQALADDGFDWETQAETLAITELDYVMEKAAEVASFSTDTIRKNIADDTLDATPERLSLELETYIKTKPDNYRILFFIDEVSQFIGSRQELLLQLQQIVTTLSESCKKRVWVGCTAQQDLTEVLDTCHINEGSDQYGKILGRFETRVSLQGTSTEYITQKRILDKDGDAEVELTKLYNAKKIALENQFNLPTSFGKYTDKDSFVNYYPFVPYQFRLIQMVLNAFVQLQFVDTEVKGNERSVLKITHKTAQDNKDLEVGRLISFDMLFSSMFRNSLKHDGQRAINNANAIIATYPDREFGQRVVNLLFMLCNISAPDKLVFPATLENITTLMMTEIDQDKKALWEKIEAVLAYLIEKSVVRVESKTGKADVYCFLSEEESEVNRLIMSQTPNANAVADAMKGIFTKYISLSNKETVNGNPFSVAVSIAERYIIGQASANLLVEFKTDSQYANPQTFALSNDNKRMVYYLVDGYQADAKLRNDFYWYCKVQEYLNHFASTASEQRSKTNDEFRLRAQELLHNSITPAFIKILDSCPIVSGQSIIAAPLLGTKKATERYKAAFAEHFKTVYPLASYASQPGVPTTAEDLKAKIRRAIQPDEYGPLNPLTVAEQEIENRLNRHTGDMVLSDLTGEFNQAPYGWNEIATVYFVNELVRRQVRALSYKGNPSLDKNLRADTILKERNSYTITAAQKIDQQLVTDFIAAWKDVFNAFGNNYPMESSELFNMCHNDPASPLLTIPSNYAKYATDLAANNAATLAKVLQDAADMFTNEWHAERDPEKFFRLVVDKKAEGKTTIDKCKQIVQFHESQMTGFNVMCNFVKENKDNFDFVHDEEGKKFVEELKGIFTDENLITNLPAYKKRVDALKTKLAEVKKQLVDNIKKAYDNVLDELEQYAKDNGVSFDRSQFKNFIEAKTTTNNFYALEKNADTSAFRAAQIKAIDDKIPVPAPISSPGSNGGVQPPKPVIKRKYVHPSDLCKAQKIKSIEDLNKYVDGIKAKLIEALGDNDEIVVS